MRGWLAGFKTERSAGWLRAVPALLGAALALLAGFMVLAYKLTAERVPAHRAALERLVRAETGLDLRFDALGLRWGWYGPEAVFSRVELGEPLQAKVLLRAPELIVGFDRLGKPAHRAPAGRAHHARGARHRPAALCPRAPRQLPRPQASAATLSIPAARILSRWRGGRIDIEGGTLHIADPQRSAERWWCRSGARSVYRSAGSLARLGLRAAARALGRNRAYRSAAARGSSDASKLKWQRRSLRACVWCLPAGVSSSPIHRLSRAACRARAVAMSQLTREFAAGSDQQAQGSAWARAA